MASESSLATEAESRFFSPRPWQVRPFFTRDPLAVLYVVVGDVVDLMVKAGYLARRHLSANKRMRSKALYPWTRHLLPREFFGTESTISVLGFLVISATASSCEIRSRLLQDGTDKFLMGDC